MTPCQFPRRRGIMRNRLLGAALTALSAFWCMGDARAAVITFSSLVNPAASATFGTIPGHELAPGAAIPNFTWNYSGNYGDPRLPAFHASFSDHICIGPAGACGSNNNDGAAGNEYAGFEFVYFTFNLPAGAVNVALRFDDFDADDRSALGVNDTQIGGFKSTAAIGGTLVTNMKDSSGVHNVLFLRPPLPVINNQALFHPGENFLTFWVNNTNSLNLNASAIPHVSSGDPSALRIRGGVTYDLQTIPEPAPMALLALGIALLATFRKKVGSE